MTFTDHRSSLYLQLIALVIAPFAVICCYFIYSFVYHYELLVRHAFPAGLAMSVLLLGTSFALIYIVKLARGIYAIENTAHNIVNGTKLPLSKINTIAEISKSLHYLYESSDEEESQSKFAEEIAHGNFQATYIPKHADDQLGHALVMIKENLASVKIRDEQRNWASDGLAKFVTILQATKNLKDLSNDIIINLVRIVHANQGSVFLFQKNDSDQGMLVMQACYAYNRSKHLTREIAPGEGLIGQAFLEKETIYLKDVPDHFVKITSGLGESNPKNILIVPLKMNETIVGIIEIASFRLFEKHEIDFVEKISESIAHTITSFQIAENTRKLLDESQAHAEQMRAQEEELRQNQEELQATQEEISRKYEALFKQLGELNYESKFDQLKSITFTKKRSIEYYFNIIRNQILTFAEDRMIIEAIKSFHISFYQVEKTITEEAHEQLCAYYENEFLPRLNDNSSVVGILNAYLPHDERARALQYLYIANNTHPTGKKSLLNDALDGSDYSRVHALYHPILRNFLEKFGYYDIFLIDAKTGDMLYSVFKEVDFATSLLSGEYHNTNFGTVVKKAMESTDKNFVSLIDFEPYDPSYHAPASFIACPVYEKNEKIGILVFQMPINKINQILTGDNKWFEDGLGETGETVMIGDDYKLRSIVRSFIENPKAHLDALRRLNYDESILQQMKKMETNILLEEIKCSAVTKALKGSVGTLMEQDENGNKMLHAFAPLDIPDVHWIILSRMKETEASTRINSLRNNG